MVVDGQKAVAGAGEAAAFVVGVGDAAKVVTDGEMDVVHAHLGRVLEA